MPLRIRFDDRVDRLADALIDHFAAAPAHPFAEDVVLVPTVGVGRWLQQRFAQRFGVCARLRPEFAGRFLWRSMGALIPRLAERSPFDPATARWSILRLFDDLPTDGDCAPLAARVGGAPIGDRLALATQIADHFERYLAWRRDWLDRWQAGRWAEGDAPLGPNEGWQRWLWRALLERLPGVSDVHPYDRLDALLAGTPKAPDSPLAGQRVAVFGTVGMSPEQWAVLAKLSTVLDVSLYVNDPCRELWSDLVDPKSLARLRASRPDAAWLYDGEPAVLGSWGRAQRDHVAQVLALEEAVQLQADAPFRDASHPLDPLVGALPAELVQRAAQLPRSLTRLQALHAAVLLRSDRPWLLVAPDVPETPPSPDPSIQLHATHGLIREAEVLHDRLLDCFATMPDLQPGEVAVFCASIDDAADAIEAVFSGAPAARRIPIAVSGRGARVDPLLRAALEVLELAGRNAPLAGVAEWLANPAVLEALRLDDDSAGALVRAFEGAGAFWGLDSAGGPARHHWRAALDRLLLGAAAGTRGGLVGDEAPAAGLRRMGTQPLERFMPVLDALDALRTQGLQPRPVAQWSAFVRRIFLDLFGPASRRADSLAQLLDAVAAVSDSAAFEPQLAIDAPAYRAALAEELERGATAALASGAVSVCPIGGLRAIPFRVIVLFGMDEGALPRAQPRGEFDLMRRSPRFGDRIARFDDRAVFLDSILAARERLIVFYRGRDPRDDSPRNPSMLVTELVDYVNARVPRDCGALTPRIHPLHAFSARAFGTPDSRGGSAATAGSQARSFADEWVETASAIASPLSSRSMGVGALSIAVSPDKPDPSADVASFGEVAATDPRLLDELRDALADPAKTWLRRSVGMRLIREESAIEETEPLWGDASRDRDLLDSIARRLLGGESADRLFDELLANPRIAAGAAGRVQAGQLIGTARELCERFDTLTEPPEGPAQRIVSAFNLGMRALIDAWLRHAQWAQQAPELNTATVLVTPDATVTVRSADPSFALAHAQQWAERIRAQALPLFPATTRAWHESGGDHEKAHRALFGDDGGFVVAEIEKPWFAALYRDAEPGLDEVVDIGMSVYGPILADCAIVKVKK